MKLKLQHGLDTGLDYIASRGLKSLHEGPGGLAAASIDDMMEATGPNDPDSIGERVNVANTPWDQDRDGNPQYQAGKQQEDSSQVSSGGPSAPGGKSV